MAENDRDAFSSEPQCNAHPASTVGRDATPAAAAAAPSMVGQSLGRYALQECLGKGRFAEVYLAVDTKLDRQVAVKFPRLGDIPDADARPHVADLGLALHESQQRARPGES